MPIAEQTYLKVGHSRTPWSGSTRLALLMIGLILFPGLIGQVATIPPGTLRHPAPPSPGRPSDDVLAGRFQPGTPRLPVGLSESDWSSILAAHEREKYTVSRTSEGWSAWSPAQRWTTSFDERGFLIRALPAAESTPESWSWGLEFAGYGYGEQQTAIRGRAAAVQTKGAELKYHWDIQPGEQIEEWYRNEARGFEHGFTINDRPRRTETEAPAPRLNLTLRIRGTLGAERSGNGRAISFRLPTGEVVVNYSGLKVWDARGRELPAEFAEAAPDHIRIAIDEREAVYPITVDPVAQQTYLKAGVHSVTGEEFGTAVAISGDTVVVGAPSDDSESRGVNQPATYAYPFDDSGTVFVFVRSGTTWTQQAHLKSSNSWTGDRFGTSVAISGNTIVVGAPGESQTSDGVDGAQCLPPSSSYCARANDFPILTAPGVGAAYVFVRTGTTWTQQNYLKASNSEEEDSFGYAVAIHGDTILIGAHGEDSAAGLNGDQNDNSAAGAGAAYVFLRNGSSWIQQAYLKSAVMAANDQFGYAVAIHQDTAVIGAVFQGDGAALSGAAYVFKRTGATWSQQAQLKAPTPVSSDYFGGAVGVHGDRIVIGATGEDTGGAESGAAYVFRQTGGTWSQEAALKASDIDPDDNFGFSVAIQDSVVIVTASNENGTGEGAAYVFVLQSSRWVESALLRGRKTEAFDRFGSAVAIFDETAIIGARYEESDATGIDGDEDNNLLGQTGAAYTFLVEPVRVSTNIVANTRQTSPGGVATIYITLTNPGSTARDADLTFTIPDQLIVVPGSCNGAGGICTIGQSTRMVNDGHLRRAISGKAAPSSPGSGPWVINWTGLIAGNGSLTISFQVQIGNQVSSGSQVCIPLVASGKTQSVCFTVAAPPSGPGTTIPVAAAANPQKAGSVLIYNLYTSGLNTAVHDTRLTITNTSPVNPINVHLFFVDGASCAVADQFVTLTQNQTLSMLASEIDPGVTGYVIGVATDDRGCPINQNDLIGGALVKFEQGHRANLPAMGIAAISGQLATCNDTSTTATLAFDGSSYNTLPRTLALASLPSRANVNETMLVINRLGGNLSSGATRLETLAGLLFDDQESSQSFTLSGGNCQLTGMLGNNFPRTSPRYDAVIPAGRTGWMKLSQVNDGAISGAMINLSTTGFSQGHNLHVLSTTATVSLTIPVYPAR